MFFFNIGTPIFGSSPVFRSSANCYHCSNCFQIVWSNCFCLFLGILFERKNGQIVRCGFVTEKQIERNCLLGVCLCFWVWKIKVVKLFCGCLVILCLTNSIGIYVNTYVYIYIYILDAGWGLKPPSARSFGSFGC